MSRFYTNHEINKKDKQLSEEVLLNASKYKNDLKQAINIENHRINIDSAKKKAVMQRMDYDGFHQMVLGADLQGIKSKELMDLKPNDTIMNAVLIHKKLNNEKDLYQNSFVPDSNNKIQNIISTNVILENFKTFQKMWKNSKTINEKISLIFDFQFQIKFSEFLKNNLEADLFVDLFFSIGSYILENIYLENEKTEYLLECINSVINDNKFGTLKKFLGCKQKSIFIEINKKLSEEECKQINETDQDEKISTGNKFKEIFEQILNKIN